MGASSHGKSPKKAIIRPLIGPIIAHFPFLFRPHSAPACLACVLSVSCEGGACVRVHLLWGSQRSVFCFVSRGCVRGGARLGWRWRGCWGGGCVGRYGWLRRGLRTERSAIFFITIPFRFSIPFHFWNFLKFVLFLLSSLSKSSTSPLSYRLSVILISHPKPSKPI